MQRRALLAGGIAWSAIAGAAFAEDDLVYLEGFLVFDRKVQFPPGAYIYVYVAHGWGMQHGNGSIVIEKSDITDSNMPWGYKLAAGRQNVFEDGLDIVVLAAVEDTQGHTLFRGGIRKSPHELIGKRQRIEMHYNDGI